MNTEFFCALFGSDLRWSPTPARYRDLFAQHRFRATYIPCQISDENLDAFAAIFMNFISDVENFLGAHITMPFKKHVVSFWPYEMSDAVRVTGAANIVYKNLATGRWALDNLDVWGVQKTLERFVPLVSASGAGACRDNALVNILLLGAGGAAAAAAYALQQREDIHQVFVHTRTVEAAMSCSVFTGPKNFSLSGLSEHEFEKTWQLLQASDLPCVVISALPLGRLEGQSNPYALKALDFLHSCLGLSVGYFDMIYDPTTPLALAQTLNLPHMDGQLMLESQTPQTLKFWDILSKF